VPLSVLVSSRPSHPPSAFLLLSPQIDGFATCLYHGTISSCFIMAAIVLFLSLSLLPCIFQVFPSLFIRYISVCRLRSSLASYASPLSPPSLCNDPRSLPLSLCPTGQLFRNDVIRAIGVDSITFLKNPIWNCLMVQILVIIFLSNYVYLNDIK